MNARRQGISARLALLDHQLPDADGLPVGRVDDVELSVPTSGAPPEVEAVLTGAEALGQRLGGLTGAVMAGAASRLRPTTGMAPRSGQSATFAWRSASPVAPARVSVSAASSSAEGFSRALPTPGDPPRGGRADHGSCDC